MNFNIEIVKRQIISVYLDLYGSDRRDEIWSLGDCIDVFRYFYRRYIEIFDLWPPRISNETVKNIILKFPYLRDDFNREFDLSPEDYPPMIDAYFYQHFEDGCNYSIAHFMSGNIRALRYFETLY